MRTVWKVINLTIGSVVLVVFGLLVAGGIRYQVEVEFTPDSNTGETLPDVHIQNTRVAGWGNLDILGFSSYGPPFDVFVSGSIPQTANATSASVIDMRIEADGKQIFFGERADLDFGESVVSTINFRKKAKGFGFSPVASLPNIPLKFRIFGQLVLRSSNGDEVLPFERSFSLHSTRRFSIGTWSWHL